MGGDIRKFFAPSSASDSNPKKKQKVETKKQKVETKNEGHNEKESVDECSNENAPVDSSKPFDAMEGQIDASWREQLSEELKKPYFSRLKVFLNAEAKSKRVIYPPSDQIFSCLNHCPFDKLKVVIIGQDPYHGPNQAHGLCFSVARGVKIPPSLRNVYKEAMNDVGISNPSHGCLTSWSEQGVLLLNSVLTVRQANANSHKKQGWEQFTDAIIRVINTKAENVVFLLWGKPAQEKCSYINTSKHCVIRSSHPSPLGATKTSLPFITSKCFSRANAYLAEHGKEQIDWNVY